MSIRVIDPRYMTVQKWADAMVPTLEQYGNLGRLLDETKWQEWACQLLTLPKISGSVVDPRGFSDWRAWAMRLNQNLSVVP